MSTSDIQITLEITKTQDNTSGLYRLKVRVTEYQNIQAEIFVFQREPDTGNDVFYNVATPAQLGSLPKHQPQPGELFFLEHTVELEFNTASQMTDTEMMIIADVTQLKTDWDLVRDQIDTTYTVVI